MVLDSVDILQHLITESEFDCSVFDTLTPNQLRAALRLLCHTSRLVIDSNVTTYRDCRRARDTMLLILPQTIAEQACFALRRFGPLRQLQLEGLDDVALDDLLCEISHSRAGCCLEVLSLQRSVFAAATLHACSPLVPKWMGPTIMPSLLELELGGCGALTDAGLEALTSAAPALLRLRVTVNALLRRPRLSCPKLRFATLAICANLMDVAVDHLCLASPLLEELSLWRCSSLTAPSLRGAHLTIVNLSECISLEDRALSTLLRHCPRLTNLSLAGCEALSCEIADLAHTVTLGSPPVLPGGACLTTLDASDICGMNDALLSAMCQFSPALRHLDFSRSGAAVQFPQIGGEHLLTLVGTRCEALSDMTVSSACDKSPLLSSLMLALCSSLYSPRIHGECLTDVNLSGCTALQDGAVTHVCMHSPHLARLSLSLCASLVEPVVRGSCLRRVELSHCEKLARPSIGGECIEQLSFSGCSTLEDRALEAACAGCPRLAKLSINGCGKLVAARLVSASLQTLSCQNVPRAVIEAAADRTFLPLLERVVSEDVGAPIVEEVE